VLPSVKNSLDECNVVHDGKRWILRELLWRKRLNPPTSQAIPESVETADVELPSAVPMPITGAERREGACVKWNILGTGDEDNAAITSCAEREKRDELRLLLDERGKGCRTLAKNTRKHTNNGTPSWRFGVLVGVMGIRESLGDRNLDNVADTRSFTRR